MKNKILLGIMLLSLIFTPISALLKINQAEAVLGVGDVGTVNINSNTDPGTVAAQHSAIAGWIKDAASWVWNQKDVISKWALKTAGQVLKHALLNRLVDATVAWINRGGQGAIIDNWDQFLNKAGNDAAGLFIQSLGGGFLCSPFNVHVQLALLPVKQFSQYTCSLDQIVNNVEAFENDFKNGGWIAYQAQWEPRNNFYGATIMALNDKALAEASARENANSQALAGKGFLSFEKEEYVLDPNGPYIDKNGTPFGPPIDPKTYTGPRYSKIKRIITPGDYVGNAITQTTLATPFNALIGADDTSAYISAIVNAAINKLTVLGVEGLQGVFKKKTSDFTTVTPSAPCSGLTGDAFRSCLGYYNVQKATYQNDRATILGQINDTLTPRQEAAGILTQLISQQTQLVDSLQLLSACRPSDSSITSQLSEEQATLDDLKDKFDTNQTFLEPLQEAATSINSATTADWSALAIQSSNNQSVLDSGSANDFLTAVNVDKDQISAAIVDKLQSTRTQLATCPKAVTPSNTQ